MKIHILVMLIALLACSDERDVEATEEVREFESIINPQVQPERVATGYRFLEGPLWLSNNTLNFSDLSGNRLYNYDPAASTVRLVLEQSGGQGNGAYPGSNGQTYDAEGNVVICQHANHQLAILETNGQITPLVSSYNGRRLNSPNDIARHPTSGALYFTDPTYGNTAQVQPTAVYRYHQGTLTLVANDIRQPNGLDFSPDGSVLYVGSMDAREVRSYSVQADGTLVPRGVFYPGACDGLKVDAEGNLYLATGGPVEVVSPEGTRLGEIRFAEGVYNLAFGGADRRTLYVTASSSIYRIPVLIAGR